MADRVPPPGSPVMDGLAGAQLEALSSPTRREAYQELLRQGRPLTVTEVADHLGVTPNMARRHLGVLIAAGLVDEYTEERTSRGRPRRLYLGRPDALPGWGVEGAFATVATLLAEVNRDGADPYDVGYRYAAGLDHEDLTAEDRLWLSLLAAGFRPCTEPGAPDRIVLRSCAVQSAAEVDPTTVCTLHRGLIDGVLGRRDPGVGLRIRPPAQAGCVVRLPSGRATTSTLARWCED